MCFGEQSIKSSIDRIKKDFLSDLSLSDLTKESSLRDLKVKYLGRKSAITKLLKDLRDVDPSEKPLLGKLINNLKVEITASLGNLSPTSSENKKSVDTTLPGSSNYIGGLHPLVQVTDKMVDILVSMGFSIYLSPEMETDYYNYSSLNYEENHPARDMQDTFYIDKKRLLRSHTTNFQNRVMKEFDLPIRMASPGKCYRNETASSRSSVNFHQIDVLYIDKGVNFGDLLFMIKEFYSSLFDLCVEIRVRPSYFPFVEPGIEVDILCTLCSGKGCKICKESGWLEVCGAGMVHPNVLTEGGVDPEEYSGFAWGGGIERICMLMYGIDNIRLFYENDLRFLEQFI